MRKKVLTLIIAWLFLFIKNTSIAQVLQAINEVEKIEFWGIDPRINY